jgi:hypothetical protein
VLVAIGSPGNWTAAESKIRVIGMAIRPAAGPFGERADLFGRGQADTRRCGLRRSFFVSGPDRKVGWGGCLGACHGGRFRRWFRKERSGGLRVGAAVCPGRRRGGGLLDLGQRHRPRGQEAEHNVDPAGDAAIAALPTSHASRANAEQLGDTVLRDAECAECLARRRCGSAALLVAEGIIERD